MKITLTPDNLASESIVAPSHGASVVFHGVVRGLENGLPITGIDYSCYPSMAEHGMAQITREAHCLFGNHQGTIAHRVGFVAVGESAITINVQTERSSEAFEACQWYLRRIKEDIPIWKKPMFVEPPSQQ